MSRWKFLSTRTILTPSKSTSHCCTGLTSAITPQSITLIGSRLPEQRGCSTPDTVHSHQNPAVTRGVFYWWQFPDQHFNSGSFPKQFVLTTNSARQVTNQYIGYDYVNCRGLAHPAERDLSLPSRLLLRAGGLLALPIPCFDYRMGSGQIVISVTARDTLIPPSHTFPDSVVFRSRLDQSSRRWLRCLIQALQPAPCADFIHIASTGGRQNTWAFCAGNRARV